MKKMRQSICLGLILTLGATQTWGNFSSDSGQSNIKGVVPSNLVTVAIPTYDIAFKGLFGNYGNAEENNKILLMGFLNALYYPDAGEDGEKIREITYLQEVELTEEKTTIFDLHLQCHVWENRFRRPNKVDYYLIIEMQRKKQEFFLKRTIYYLDKILVEETEKGTDYRDLSKSKALSLLLNPFNKDYGIIFDVVETIQNRYTRQYFGPASDLKLLTYIQLSVFAEQEQNECLRTEEWNKIPFVLKQWLSLLSLELKETKTGSKAYQRIIDISQYTDGIVQKAAQKLHEIGDTNQYNLNASIQLSNEKLALEQKQKDLDAAKEQGRREERLKQKRRNLQREVKKGYKSRRKDAESPYPNRLRSFHEKKEKKSQEIELFMKDALKEFLDPKGEAKGGGG